MVEEEIALSRDHMLDLSPKDVLESSMTDSRFRHDAANYQWDVDGVRRDAMFLDSPFGPIRYRGKYGLPVQGPSPRALREALALIEKGLTGRHVIDRDLVITIDGLEEHDRVSMLEGPGVGIDEVS